MLSVSGVLQVLSAKNRNLAEGNAASSPRVTPIGSFSSDTSQKGKEEEEKEEDEEGYSLEVKDVAIMKLDFVLEHFSVILRHKGREGPLKNLIKVL
jgi:hypothetical protein